ncbi:hypothetical protein [Actinomadura kijaniata]|uniref:hypothetical protein n=1 Tax=Actinomadura kijaniata TaxID=46161 RepID=UPI00083167E6|nr:hypothetical protein [Actinomadura kijaniata]
MDRNDPGQDADLRRLSGAARVADRDLAADPELRALLDDLRDGVMATARPRRLAFRLPMPRRLVPALAAVLTMALILGGGLALRQPRTDHGTPATSSTAPSTAPAPRPKPTGGRNSFGTGLYGASHAGKLGPHEAADASEWLLLGHPETPGYLDYIQGSLELPPGASWTPLRHRLLLPGKRMQASFLHLNFFRYAACRWGDTWSRARKNGDTAAVDRAERFFRGHATHRFSGPDGRGGRFQVTYPIIREPVDRDRILQFYVPNCGEDWRLVGAVR